MSIAAEHVEVVVIGAGIAGLVTTLELLEHGPGRVWLVGWGGRGGYGDGTSVPRFHLTWGCGKALVDSVWSAIERHPRRGQLEVRFRTRVTELLVDGDGVSGCRFVSEDASEAPAGEVSAPV